MDETTARRTVMFFTMWIFKTGLEFCLILFMWSDPRPNEPDDSDNESIF